MAPGLERAKYSKVDALCSRRHCDTLATLDQLSWWKVNPGDSRFGGSGPSHVEPQFGLTQHRLTYMCSTSLQVTTYRWLECRHSCPSPMGISHPSWSAGALSSHSGIHLARCHAAADTTACLEKLESLQGPSAWPPACGQDFIQWVTSICPAHHLLGTMVSIHLCNGSIPCTRRSTAGGWHLK